MSGWEKDGGSDLSDASDEEVPLKLFSDKKGKSAQEKRFRKEDETSVPFKQRKKKKKERVEEKDGDGVLDRFGFETLGLSPWLVDACKRFGMTHPTPIQKDCIGPTSKGCNVIGSAPTGSGKTAAFALPILEHLARDPFGVHSVVVTPTRELAMQIADHFNALGADISLRCQVIIGGLSQLEQAEAISKRPHVIVGTPGRLASHILGPDPPKLSNLAFLVLDEADRLLDSGFAKDLKVLFQNVPGTRQTLLYSATMSKALETLRSYSAKSKRKMHEFHVSSDHVLPEGLDERYLLMPKVVKPAYLGYVVRSLGPLQMSGALRQGPTTGRKPKKYGKKLLARRRKELFGEAGENVVEEDESEREAISSKSDPSFYFERAQLMIVFVSSKSSCQLIGMTLKELGVECSILHSGLSQARRLAALGKFRSRITKVLVATDVASRGLDIPRVDLVLNYDVPRGIEDYIHRVGRTARAGRPGLAVTFITQYDISLVLAVEKLTNSKLKLLPDVNEEKDVLVLLTRVTNALRAAAIQIQAEREKNIVSL